jgi:uracil-DNA glycosylase family 4
MRRTYKQKNTKACQNCPLSRADGLLSWYVPTEIQEVDGKVDLFFVGEAPGKEEDKQCMPFVGRSGQLLRKAIRHVVQSAQVGMAFGNIARCNPRDASGGNRAPNEEEIECCRGYLEQDIIDLNPEVIVLLGGTAMYTFFGTEEFHSVGEGRGVIRELTINGQTFPTIVCYHPAAALRNPNYMTLVVEDITKALQQARGKVNKKDGRKGKCTILKTVPEVKEFYDFLHHDAEGVVSFDTETRNLNRRFNNDLVMMQFGNDAMMGYVVPFKHWETPFDEQQLSEVKNLTVKLFTEPVNFSAWVMHNSQFDLCQVKRDIGIWIRNRPVVDTMVMTYLLNENRLALKSELKGRMWALKGLAREFLGFFHYSEEDMAVRSAGDLHKLPLQQLSDYGAMDAYVTWRLYHYLVRRAEDSKYKRKMLKLAKYLLSPAMLTFSVLEMNGFKVDIPHLKNLRGPQSPIKLRMQEIIEELNELDTVDRANDLIVDESSCGMTPIFGKPWEFHIKKRDHLSKLFFDVLALDPLEEGASGPKMDKLFLAEYAKYDPETEEPINEPALVKEHREMEKLDTSYTASIWGFVDPEEGNPDCQDGRVRARFNCTMTVTGRSTSDKPNLQQVPRGDNPAKKAIKNIYTSEPGTCLVQLDYATNEVRWLAIIAKDPVLAKAFNAGKKLRDAYRKNPTPELRDKALFEGDLHRQTASTFFNIKPSQVTKQQRTAAKSIVFGLIYGRHYKSIAQQIGVSDSEAKKLSETFMSQFPASAKWLEFIQQFAQHRSYVESPIGRRRRLDAFIGGDKQQVAAALRQARNSPIQGVASDACLIGASQMTQYILDNDLASWKGQNAVHDSFVSQVPIDEVADYIAVAKEKFTTEVMDYMTDIWGVEFPCPLEVDFDIGKSWGELKGWDGAPTTFDPILDWVKENDAA